MLQILCRKIGRKRISDTIELFQYDIHMPGNSFTDRAIIVAAGELTSALEHANFKSPINQVRDTKLEALR